MSELPEEFRYTTNADGSPALRVALVLSQQQAIALAEWFDRRCHNLKLTKWHDWNHGDMALRTICSQIDSFSGRAFGKPLPHPGDLEARKALAERPPAPLDRVMEQARASNDLKP